MYIPKGGGRGKGLKGPDITTPDKNPIIFWIKLRGSAAGGQGPGGRVGVTAKP